MIRAIVALDDKRGIAAHGAIPWDIPADKQYFRKQTEHGIVLMGSTTYEAFTDPLPNRRNIVVSRRLDGVRDGFELINDGAQFLQSATEDVWIIGGAGIYKAFLGYCDELFITHVVGDYQCDTFFPAFADAFSLQTITAEQTQHNYRFTFAVYTKNR